MSLTLQSFKAGFPSRDTLAVSGKQLKVVVVFDPNVGSGGNNGNFDSGITSGGDTNTNLSGTTFNSGIF